MLFRPFFLWGILTLTVSSLNAQYITTGQYQQFDYYHDYLPDTSLFVPTPSGSTFLSLDVNGDGSNDLSIGNHCQYYTQWGGERTAFITPMSGTEITYLQTDTCYTQDSVPMLALINGYVRAFGYGTLLNNNQIWVDTALYLKRNLTDVTQPVGSMAGTMCSHFTVSVASVYVGVRIINPDTLYGWIKLSVLQGTNSDSVVVDELAGQTSLVSVQEETSVIDPQISPNPSSGVFTLTGTSQVNEVIITDLTGHTVYYSSLAGINSIDLSLCAEGVYHCRFISGDEVIYRRLVVCR